MAARGLFPVLLTAIDCGRLLYIVPRLAFFYDPPSRGTAYKPPSDQDYYPLTLTSTSMPLFDRVTDVLARIGPAKSTPLSRPMGAGIGRGGHGMVPFGDDVSLNWRFPLGLSPSTSLPSVP